MGAIARGKRVGRYELVHVLGEGGMGTVWLGHPIDAPDQLVAIKTVAPRYASDPRVCTMFIKEAKLASAIDHPNVVRLYDVGLSDDVPFFVMEWIDGFSLRNVAHTVADSGDRVPPGVALRIASDLCAGLHAAHELRGDDGEHLGLVHRDVSPHNVLITREGIAKLIDFGVAKARDLATGSEPSVSGGLKGKVRYMAPEQALEGKVDRRADLFAVGAVTYQLLTGRAPFEGPNELATINALLATNPVFIPEELPEPVKWILRRALARKPENRFSDAQEMIGAIELALVDLGLRDQHADVAECLGWFDPREEDEAFTSARQIAAPLAPIEEPDVATDIDPPKPAPSGARSVAPPLPSNRSNAPPPLPRTPTSPPLAFSATSVPKLSDPPPITARRAPQPKAASGGSLRFVLAGAGFVGVLGLGAALIVQTAPSGQKTKVPDTVEIDEEPAAEAADAEAAPVVQSSSPTTPVIDMGDLEDKKRGGKTKPRRRAPPAASAARPATPAKSGDLAGPLKVWK
jgi:serine/threonine protein kinase